MTKDTSEHIRDSGTWSRVPYMVIYLVILHLVGGVLTLVTALQFLLKLFTGEVNGELKALGGTLGAYLASIAEYLTYHVETKPYPFGPWPRKVPAKRSSSGRGAGQTA